MWEHSAAFESGGVQDVFNLTKNREFPFPHQSTKLGHVESQWAGRPLGKGEEEDGTEVVLGL